MVDPFGNANTKTSVRIRTFSGVLIVAVTLAYCAGSTLQATAFGSPESAETSTLNLGEGVTMELALIPAGEFSMGSPLSQEGRSDNESPPQRVKISKPFHIGRHEVTVGQFRRFVEATGYSTDAEKGVPEFEDGKRGANVLQPDGAWVFDETASWRKPGFAQTDDHPVVLISWNDATAFMEWLSKSSGRKVRFPTEAEWEYAARGPTSTRYWWGDENDSTGRVANVADRSHKKQFSESDIMDMDDGFVFTSPAGKFRPNEFGLFDMTGNVWEWCSDWYDADASRKISPVDPQGPASGTHRVMRGGGWDSNPDSCRSAKRWRGGPAVRSVRVGLRVVIEP